MASRQQRTELTIEDRLEIIKLVKNNKCSRKDLQEHYKVSNHTINRILTREDQLKNTKNNKMRRIRSGNNKLVDEAVSKWYRTMLEQNIYVNGPLLRQQAVRIARMMNNNTFEANNGWLWRWQKKENVKFNSSLSGRKAAVKPENLVNKSVRDTNAAIELADNSSQSVCDSNPNVLWPMANHLGDSGISHFEAEVKEEEDDLERNPFEADVVFDIESDEQGGYDNETNRNSYPPECVSLNDGQEAKIHQDEDSMEHESFQDNTYHRQPFEVKEEIHNFHYKNDSEDESNRLEKRKGLNNDKKNPQDIYSIYGDYIARRLRASANERDNYEIYIAQHNIDDVIFKLSMGSYARREHVQQDSSSWNNVEHQTKQTDQSSQNQPHESIITEKQIFPSSIGRNSKSKTNGLTF